MAKVVLIAKGGAKREIDHQLGAMATTMVFVDDSFRLRAFRFVGVNVFVEGEVGYLQESDLPKEE